MTSASREVPEPKRGWTCAIVSSVGRAVRALDAFDLRLCRKVESGDAPAKVFGIRNVDEMIGKLERCRGCGSFERIESEVLPAARKMRELLEEIRERK